MRCLVLDWLNLRYLLSHVEMPNRKLDVLVWNWREKLGLESHLGAKVYKVVVEVMDLGHLRIISRLKS